MLTEIDILRDISRRLDALAYLRQWAPQLDVSSDLEKLLP